jgi:flavin reductase (DIM6/NTAB) family NADH-FMN oxidoreductase RutF
MDIQALFKIQCGLYVAAVATPEKMNGLITNTLMQQTHTPVKLGLTLDKSHLTHDMVMKKRSVAVSALSDAATPDLVKRFGFVSGRNVDKFDGFDAYELDENGNPLLTGPMIAAVFSLTVFEAVDLGTHTFFLCGCDEARNGEGTPITYLGYRESLKK